MEAEKTTQIKNINEEEACALVVEVNKKVQDFIMEELKAIHPKQRWLLYSRIINCVFFVHYQLTMNGVRKHVDEEESAEKTQAT